MHGFERIPARVREEGDHLDCSVHPHSGWRAGQTWLLASSSACRRARDGGARASSWWTRGAVLYTVQHRTGTVLGGWYSIVWWNPSGPTWTTSIMVPPPLRHAGRGMSRRSKRARMKWAHEIMAVLRPDRRGWGSL